MPFPTEYQPFPWTNAPHLARPITVIQNMQGQTCFGPPTDPQLKINPSLLMARSSQKTKKKHKVLAVIGEPGHSAAGPLSWRVSTALGWVRWWEVTCRFLPDQSMRLLHPLFPHFLCTTLTCPLSSRWGQRLRFLWPYPVLSDSHIRLLFHTYLF